MLASEVDGDDFVYISLKGLHWIHTHGSIHAKTPKVCFPNFKF